MKRRAMIAAALLTASLSSGPVVAQQMGDGRQVVLAVSLGGKPRYELARAVGAGHASIVVDQVWCDQPDPATGCLARVVAGTLRFGLEVDTEAATLTDFRAHKGTTEHPAQLALGTAVAKPGAPFIYERQFDGELWRVAVEIR